ncbi:polymorphic toxin-type HINT domain-containing protein [Streptomyces sp. NBC_01317]|uniref:polymorphic toxin-type HINT domain-containing protein n=1 Tax=Streptomyces sp. NBC_01317 TaxID=2903822 RepID=UPI002E10F203|nr:polymorphic toxin-type HINT domain-containing protein [Streptomyces sp. NBC_01317]
MAGRGQTRTRRRIALSLAAVMVCTLVQAVTMSPAEARSTLPKVPASEKALSGHGVKALPRTTGKGPKTPAEAPLEAWPGVGSATVSLPSAGAAESAPWVKAGKLPITLTASATKTMSSKGRSTGSAASAGTDTPLSGRATVRVLDRKTAERAGVEGMLFSVQRVPGADGEAFGVGVDYAAFAQAYGGAYATRLRLVQLPACAATRPGARECSAAEPVAARNNSVTQTLTATGLTLPAEENGAYEPILLAVTTAASSDHGDYTASQLSASSAWQTNLNTGDFSWSYDMPVPQVPGGFVPQVGLTYSSAGVDGRTSSTNNQSSWAGDGFDLSPGFIERSYKSCVDEGVKNADGLKPGDMCWGYDNATLSFNGHSGELIPDGTDAFKVKGDDGTKVERIYGSATDVRDNGDNDQEYWRVTTTDGVQYYFGYHKLPGWKSGNETTDSTWTLPVYGNDTGEKCHAAAFADSWCQQAWRWNLDYAVDPRGNAIAYYYDKETNYYGRNLKPADETAYTRGGTLDRIEYGLRSTTVYSAKALATADFTSSERCLPEAGVTCAAATIDDKASYWYDTPWDLNCVAGKDCTNSAAPTFWTRKRLTDVTTSVLGTDGAYDAVDSWKLAHHWGMADIDRQLLLDSVEHTGSSAAPAITLPKVTFGYDQRANRLDLPGDDTSPFIKERLNVVEDESGGRVVVNYSTAPCDAANLPTPQTNSTRCYPVFFTRQGDADPSLQWFNKYVVDLVTQKDRAQLSPDMTTRYSYLDGAAWHYDDDDGLTKEKYKTWSTWRGYGHVRVQTGGADPVGMKSQTDHYFLRGMDGDKAAPAGGTKTVTVSDGNGGTITDHDSAVGFEYRTEQYDGPGGKVLEKTVSTPWHHETAKRVRSWGTTTANLTGIASARTWTSLDDGAGTSWRTTNRVNILETKAGRVIQTDDFGDESTSADNQCTRTTYVDNDSAWIFDAPSRAELVAGKCADTPKRAKDVISDVRTAYDGQDYGKAPTKGDATREAKLSSHNGTTATYLESESGYDTYGRQLSEKDISATVTATETTAPVRMARADGRTTTTAYAPATGFAKTSTVTTPPATAGDAATAQVVTTTYDPLRGQPTIVVDTNLKRTETTYDALGRNLRIWLPNRPRSSFPVASFEFTYTVDGSNPVAVGTRTLAGTGQLTSYELLDGFLRPRQTQAPGPKGGRLVTDTFYDERGLVEKAFAPYYNPSAPSTAAVKLDNSLSVETQTWNTFDGLGRTVKSQQIAGDDDGARVTSTTSTTYRGDRITMIPPKGATPTTTVSDARGNTTDLLQHRPTPSVGFDTTHYEYNSAGALIEVTDPSANKWTFGYDQRGNRISSHDPDKGDSSSFYDDRDQLIWSKDANQKTITHVYDGLGRETETHEGDASGPLLTKRTWDPSGAEGQLDSVSRYIGGASGVAYTTSYSQYDTLYRPNRVTTNIPSVKGEEALAGSYQSNTKYNVDGTVQSVSYPAVGNLPAETVVPTYDEVLRPVRLAGSLTQSTYIDGTIYSFTGKPLTYTYRNGGAKTQVNNTYELGTQRLSNSAVNRENVLGTDKSATYGYDEAGNVTSVRDVSRAGTDNQCFIYDYLGRLTEAWTQGTQTCGETPGAGLLGGPAPYWQSYSYDAGGNRLSDTNHDLSGDASKDVKRTFSYPDPGGVRPHAVTQVDTAGPTGTSSDNFTYDAAGNTKSRTLGGNTQTLAWDTEGHLQQVTVPDGAGGTKTLASYVYDADGNRLIQRTESETILYLGSTEIRLTKGTTSPKGTQYFDIGDGNQAIRTDDNKLSFLIGDHNGTSELAVNAADGAMQQRRSTPFGDPRGTSPTSWPGQNGFVGGTKDTTTGLTHLGAREYDPSLGRFLSVDPVMVTSDPQQMNGYAYGSNNPLTHADPSGACPNIDCPTRPCANCENNPPGHAAKPPKLTAAGQAAVKQQKRDTVRAQTVKKTPVVEVIQKVGWDLFKSYIGLDDIQSCVSGSVAGCGSLLIGVIPWTAGPKKALELTKSAWKIAKAIRKWRKEQKWADQILESGGSCAVPHSFLPGTGVLLADGTTKAIEDVQTGDVVVVTDPDTGRTTKKKVVATITTEDDKQFTRLTVATPDGASTLDATDTHPFWVPALKAWVNAGDLKPGQTLRTSVGTHVQIAKVVHYAKRQRTHDLTVDDVHTYYVVAGATPVLVHNAGGRSDPEVVCTLGNFAQESIPAASKSQKFTPEERRRIDEIGQAFGCHTCGSIDPFTKSGHYVPDHQPISSWVPNGTPQRLYPQCLPCSRQQAGWARQLAPIMKPLYELKGK